MNVSLTRYTGAMDLTFVVWWVKMAENLLKRTLINSYSVVEKNQSSGTLNPERSNSCVVRSDVSAISNFVTFRARLCMFLRF